MYNPATYIARTPVEQGSDGIGLLARLRQATRPAHHEMEQHPLLRALLSPDLSRQAYVRVLGAFAAFYRDMEPRLMAALDPLTIQGDTSTPYRYRPRLSVLQQDLDDLDAQPAGVSAPLPRLPPLQTPEALLGVLYVLEGATQGGRVIAPHLAQALNLGPAFGARYFHLYEAGQWPHLKRILETSSGDGAVGAAAARAAACTFSALRDGLNRSLLLPDRS
jgi:heme oxygenase (biliverdin-IX-beta and delta-forming)